MNGATGALKFICKFWPIYLQVIAFTDIFSAKLVYCWFVNVYRHGIDQISKMTDVVLLVHVLWIDENDRLTLGRIVMLSDQNVLYTKTYLNITLGETISWLHYELSYFSS